MIGLGVVCFFLAYFLYAVKCWGTDHQIGAVFMVTIPLLVYFLATSKIPDSTSNILFYLFIQFCFYGILSVILLYIFNKVKTGIGRYAFRITGRYNRNFFPRLSYSITGLVIVSLLLISLGSASLFSTNANTISQSLSSSVKNTQYDSSVSANSITQQPIATIPPTKPTLSPTQVITTPVQETGLTARSFAYILRGKSGIVNVNLYSSVYSEISSKSAPAACLRYNYDSSPCTDEEIHQYYLTYLDDSTQTKYLDNLVKSIKSKSSDTDDQARIAISLVQQIPYDYSRLYSTSFKMRSPYEVLYDDKGVCSEKSLLLAYLLRELGYGTVLFEFPSQNHMAVGIKSSELYDYRDSGYAFVETAAPSIPTDSQGDYVGVGKLTSTPNIYKISDGISFDSISEEYRDAQSFNQIEAISKSSGGVLDQNYYFMWQSLVQKYGLKIGS
ncbi:MAG: transglutaminase domain-containing protein [Methanoregula sp.]|jgi:hypothetical protein|uniref:transglutaminase domain-containing protein n=1 Tax=Methanoregula sp. TaxID=2052170 RepID=UPI003C25EB05